MILLIVIEESSAKQKRPHDNHAGVFYGKGIVRYLRNRSHIGSFTGFAFGALS